MKKIVIFLFSIVLCVFCFSGCANGKNVNALSKNLSNYNIIATLNFEEKTVSATEKIKYVNSTNQDLNEICFHLYPNAFKENSKLKVVSALNKSKCYQNGESFGKIEILECKEENITANYIICGEDENILSIKLQNELKPKSKINLEIAFKLKIPNCNHRFGYNEKTINLGNWYPIACVFENGNFVQDGYNSNGDPFYSECANYQVSITAPKHLLVAGTGNKQTKDSEDNTITTFNAKAVRDFALVLGEFETLKSTYNKIEITYYFYNDKNPQQSLDTAKQSIKTFNGLFGKYPYKSYCVVQTKFVQGGMEYPGVVLISDSLPTNEDYQMVIIHETAHQWWYGVIGNNEFKNAWQDEALAEFSTALFYKNNPSYNVNFDEYFKNLNNSYLVFEKVYREILKNLETSMNRNLKEFNTEPEYTYLTYVKGNLMFKNLYDIMGEKNFIKGIKSYYKKNKFKNASPNDLISSLSKANGKDLTQFFNNWLDGNVNLNEI